MKLDAESPSMEASSSLGERIASVRAGIAVAAQAAGRDSASVKLVGVTKRKSHEVVAEAVRLGLRDVGENYVQEAVEKYAQLPELDVRKHFIGHVQTNKAKTIVRMFDIVHSIDRLEAGLAIGKAAQALGKQVTMLVQVNVSSSDRFGVAPHGAVELAEQLRAEGFKVDGVMAMGPITLDRAEITAAFSCAAEIFGRIGGSTLSIGMSSDFCEAIACGSTLVRIGTALFGARA